MKTLVLGLIAGIAAFMAFMVWRGECPDGTILYSEADCRRSGVISDAACRTVFANADSLMRRAATVYQTLDQCMQHYEQCVRSAVADGFTPVPVGFCVTASGSSVTRQEVIYRRQNLGVTWERN
ncbi:MAG: DUF1190 domain-containing protein [Beijerinckiaceae bacterium]|jgi:uncharacterized protein YgiB involved in biofilm formation|nr:DUF1190 domain-containing protein [Beijerinckiaceae bacterium]